MKLRITFLFLLFSLIPAPSFADEYFAVTPSGAVEALFTDVPRTVIGKLSSKCIDARWTVVSSAESELVCEAPMSTMQSALGQALMGNSYSTPPRRFFRFNVTQVNGISRVQASGWMELQMAFGQMRRTDFTGPEFHNSITGFLMSSGGQLPVGTTFPNHVLIGVQGGYTPLGKFVGLRVDSIQTGSAAEAGGLKEGDIISRIAKRRFKHDEDYLDATAAAAKSQIYDVEVIRNGKPTTFQLSRAFRPSIAQAVTPQPLEKAQPTIAAAAPTSLADELAKLADLRDKGILTEEEFQAQKAKLLTR